MKKLLLSVLVIAFSLHYSSVRSQSSLRFSVGYGLPMGSNHLTDQTVSTQTSYSSKGVYGSFGSGLQFGVSYLRMFSSSVGVELGASYLDGTNYQGGLSFGDATSTTNITSTGQATGYIFSPMMVFQHSPGKWKPYVKVGLSVASLKVTSEQTQYTIVPSNPTITYNTTREYTGGLPFGLRGALGFRSNTEKNLSFFIEALFTSSSYYPSQSELTVYKMNGKDMLSTLSGSNKKTIYKTEISQNSATPPDPTKPSESVSTAFTMGSILFNFGIEIKLGKK